ncbi:MAG: glycosyltransferase family 1 protein [Spirobacillus cienkowskii]|uniref:Glycosyltransferase family 1 protein n=1 Tax=Spirobacillus cienkowskii TaxID=495820 RepID=A0A369KRU0_9BACT|nr:MAG: glycosyltransferase family 1 protein [Spirobacillus cienkowskii]
MKILMLGWEYPPIISGGLGTATEGIVKGLLEVGHEVTLVLPHFPVKVTLPKGLKIVSPENPFIMRKKLFNNFSNSLGNKKSRYESERLMSEINENYKDLLFNSHYDYSNKQIEFSEGHKKVIKKKFLKYVNSLYKNMNISDFVSEFRKLFIDKDSYQEKAYILGLLALNIIEQDSDYHVIHANDWMTFVAAKMVKEKIDIPLFVHIHSTELDRSGEINYNEKILQIEKMGLELADMIIAVSNYTKNIIVNNFKIPNSKIKVVYNANNTKHEINNFKQSLLSLENKVPIVTFVGRVTYQKGPYYFVQAAKKVLQFNSNVMFKVVGSGDLLVSMKQLVSELKLDKNFYFTGFLNSNEVKNILADSDVFVMPSVSEPFGIVALEAIAQKIPVIISKQSGVSEVLNHVLKVDFWDTDLIADRILSVLKYHCIKSEMIDYSLQDLSQRTWIKSAETLTAAYSEIPKS